MASIAVLFIALYQQNGRAEPWGLAMCDMRIVLLCAENMQHDTLICFEARFLRLFRPVQLYCGRDKRAIYLVYIARIGRETSKEGEFSIYIYTP